MKRPEIATLTSIRFVAAMWVVVFHFLAPTLEADARVPGLVAQLASAGYVGVPLFFVLSGFILAYNYEGRPLERAGARRSFWLARFARIYPVYAVAFLLAVPPKAYALATGVPDLPSEEAHWAGLVLTPLLLQSWVPVTDCTFNCPGWSLSVEAFFYLAFPLLLVASRRRGFLAAATVASFLAVVAGLGAYAAGLLGAGAIAFLAHGPPIHLAAFLLGMLMARHREALVPWARRAGPRLVFAAGWLAMAGTILAVDAWAGRRGLDPALALDTVALLPAIALVLLGAAALDGTPGLLHRPTLVLLGNASYSLYILQSPVSKYLLDAPEVLLGVALRDTYLGFALAVAVLIPLSVLAHRWLEVPMQRRIVAWGRPAPAAAAA